MKVQLKIRLKGMILNIAKTQITGEYYNFTQESNMNYGNAVS